MIKVAIITGTVVIGAVLAVNAINGYLGPDDLKDCVAPDLLTPKCAPADVIVAISGGDTQARTAEAVKLYQAGWASKLLFSGAAVDTSGPSNAEAMRTQALKAGVPESAILTDSMAQNTADNARGTMQLLTSKVSRIILVTSPYHQRRASLEFKHVFGERVTIVSHPTQTDRGWGEYWWTSFHGWWVAATETTMSWVLSTWR